MMLLKDVLVASTHSEFPQRRDTRCTGSGRQLLSDWSFDGEAMTGEEEG